MGDTNLDTSDLIDKIRDLPHVDIETIHSVDDNEALVAIVPDGMKVKDITRIADSLRANPRRRTGTAKVDDLDSLIGHVNRFKDPDSILFGHFSEDESPPLARITGILNYHQEAAAPTATARWGDHRVVLNMALDKRLVAWLDGEGKWLDQTEFAAFIEDRILDIAAPSAQLMANPTGKDEGEPSDQADGGDFGDKTPDERFASLAKRLGGRFAGPSKILELSKGLKLTETAKVGRIHDLTSGETQMVFETEHTDASGEKIKVPNLFQIIVPVFKGGPGYRLAVRLRYRKCGPQLKWQVDLIEAERSIEHAFGEACARAKKATDLPLLMGVPE